MPRSPITESLNRVNEAIAYLNNTLNPGEIDLLLDQLAPLPEPEPAKKPQKKSSERVIERCLACSYTRRAIHHNDPAHREYHKFDPPLSQPTKKPAGKGGGGKSARGESLKGQLSNRRQELKISPGCSYVLENGAVCNTGDNNPIHDKTFGYAGYHEYQPPATHAATGD